MSQNSMHLASCLPPCVPQVSCDRAYQSRHRDRESCRLACLARDQAYRSPYQPHTTANTNASTTSPSQMPMQTSTDGQFSGGPHVSSNARSRSPSPTGLQRQSCKYFLLPTSYMILVLYHQSEYAPTKSYRGAAPDKKKKTDQNQDKGGSTFRSRRKLRGRAAVPRSTCICVFLEIPGVDCPRKVSASKRGPVIGPASERGRKQRAILGW